MNFCRVYNLIQIKKIKNRKQYSELNINTLNIKLYFFKLINAPTTCQELFNQIFGTTLIDFVVIYFDNILFYSKTQEKFQICQINFLKITKI